MSTDNTKRESLMQKGKLLTASFDRSGSSEMTSQAGTEKDLVFLDPSLAYLVQMRDIPANPKVAELLHKWGFKKVYIVPKDVLHELTSTYDDEALSGDDSNSIKARGAYAELYQETAALYAYYTAKNVMDIAAVGSIVRRMLDILDEDKRFILRFQEFGDLRQDYFVTHAVETTVLSLVMGRGLRLVPHRLMDLGMSCFLHEIGLLHMPAALTNEDSILSDKEKYLLSSHTIVGANVLKSLGLSPDVITGVLQHHERLDGSGYTQGLKGDSISLFAKIIGVACSYHAQISERSFRKAKSGFSSLVDMIESMKNAYDRSLLLLFVHNLSVFPIGTGVLLSDASKGIIEDVDPLNPFNPLVHILRSASGELLPLTGLYKQTARLSNLLWVKGILPAEEVAELSGHLDSLK
jgi:HD-GYP domain-containing protein (c-di-GMP phosphodiesterase class II)